MARSTKIHAVRRAFSLLIEDAAHLPSLEHPVEFNHALLEFLEAVTGQVVVDEAPQQ